MTRCLLLDLIPCCPLLLLLLLLALMHRCCWLVAAKCLFSNCNTTTPVRAQAKYIAVPASISWLTLSDSSRQTATCGRGTTRPLQLVSCGGPNNIFGLTAINNILWPAPRHAHKGHRAASPQSVAWFKRGWLLPILWSCAPQAARRWPPSKQFIKFA